MRSSLAGRQMMITHEESLRWLHAINSPNQSCTKAQSWKTRSTKVQYKMTTSVSGQETTVPSRNTTVAPVWDDAPTEQRTSNSPRGRRMCTSDPKDGMCKKVYQQRGRSSFVRWIVNFLDHHQCAPRPPPTLLPPPQGAGGGEEGDGRKKRRQDRGGGGGQANVPPLARRGASPNRADRAGE